MGNESRRELDATHAMSCHTMARMVLEMMQHYSILGSPQDREVARRLAVAAANLNVATARLEEMSRGDAPADTSEG